MGVLTPRPSDVIETFEALRADSPVKATDYFYGLGVSSNYIRSERTAKNICWKSLTDFGELQFAKVLAMTAVAPALTGLAGFVTENVLFLGTTFVISIIMCVRIGVKLMKDC